MNGTAGSGLANTTVAGGGALVGNGERRRDMAADDIDLDAEAKADGDDYTQYKADDDVATETPDTAGDAFGPPAGDDLPAGAQALTELFDWWMAGAPLIKKHLAKQENPDVTKMLTDMAELIDEQAAALSAAFTQIYPEAPPLSDETALDTGTDTIKAEGEAEDAEAEANAAAGDPAADEVKADGDEYTTHKADDEDDVEAKADGDAYTSHKSYASRAGVGPARKRLEARLAKYHAARQTRVKAFAAKVAAAAVVKRMTKAAQSTVGEAAEHLDEVAGADSLTKAHRAACKYHSGALRGLVAKADAADEMPPEPPPADMPPDDVQTAGMDFDDEEAAATKSRRRKAAASGTYTKSAGGWATKAEFDAAVKAAAAEMVAPLAGEFRELKETNKRIGRELRKARQGL